MQSESRAILFTIVIPFLNEAQWLEQCLEAIQAQTLSPDQFELILVDNGSTDRSVEIISRFACARLLSEQRRDPYLARNKGIEAAQGRYVVFLDADCIPDRDWLSELKRNVSADSPSIVLGYLANPEDCSGVLRRYEEYYDAKLRYLLLRNLRSQYFGHAGNMVIRRDVFRRLGPFPPMPVVGDTEIIHRLLSQEPESKISYCASARVVHAELSSFKTCLHKLYECGTYAETYRRVSGFRTIPFSHRLRILAQCAREHRYGSAETFECVWMLFCGWLSFLAGRIMRSLSIFRTGTVHIQRSESSAPAP